MFYTRQKHFEKCKNYTIFPFFARKEFWNNLKLPDFYLIQRWIEYIIS